MKQFEQMDQMLTMQEGMLRTSQIIAARENGVFERGFEMIAR